jgi:rhombotail lipoprotein
MPFFRAFRRTVTTGEGVVVLSIIARVSLFLSLATLSSCTSFWQLGSEGTTRSGVSSSLVDYLYPEGEEPPAQPTAIPNLNLPLRVGIAFVPPQYGTSTGISAALKANLLNKVKAEFVERAYIDHIEIIPDNYLRSSQGFTGLQQVARLYGVDVMALVSYDQVAMSEDNKASILYWTIVGAYLIEGTENEVQTFVDTAVFDVTSKKLLFRAPGTDRQESKSTAIESIEAVRTGREGGFTAAMEDMTGNLVVALDDFEARLEEDPELAQVNWDEDAGGGGSAVYLALLLLAATLLPAFLPTAAVECASNPTDHRRPQ